MISIRHEKYETFIKEPPFTISINLQRTPYNCSREQNWHENIEIELCTEGAGKVLIDGEKHDIAKGDIIVVNSGAVHYTWAENFLQYTCLIISTQWCRQMDINYDEVRFQPLVKNRGIAELIERLSEIYTDRSTPMRIAKLNELLLSIIIMLTEKYSCTDGTKKGKDKKFEVIKDTVDYIQKNYDKKISLSEISKEVLIDKYTLCKEFKKYTGQTVIEYLHRYRSMKAIEYLSKGITVTETASLCGFENLSFFTKIFKRYMGRSPSHYKK